MKLKMFGSFFKIMALKGYKYWNKDCSIAQHFLAQSQGCSEELQESQTGFCLQKRERSAY